MIKSTANGQIRTLRLLAKDAKTRRALGVYAAEGKKLFAEAAPEDIAAVYVSETFAREYSACLAEKNLYESDGEDTAAWMRGAENDAPRRYYTVVSDALFSQAADTKNTQGILTVIRKKQTDPAAVLSGKDPLFIVCEHLQDPGNAGTILRSAEAAGAQAAFFTEDSVDVTNPKVVRSAMGSLFRLPVFYLENAERIIRLLSGYGVQTFAAALTGSVSYDTLDFTGGTAFLIGNESRGLSDAAVREADHVVRIPMTEKIDSLNAGVAASVLLFEAARQRRLKA